MSDPLKWGIEIGQEYLTSYRGGEWLDFLAKLAVLLSYFDRLFSTTPQNLKEAIVFMLLPYLSKGVVKPDVMNRKRMFSRSCLAAAVYSTSGFR